MEKDEESRMKEVKQYRLPTAVNGQELEKHSVLHNQKEYTISVLQISNGYAIQILYKEKLLCCYTMAFTQALNDCVEAIITSNVGKKKPFSDLLELATKDIESGAFAKRVQG
ncbi:hypothetical protein FACS1894137_13490 [Spirochaetia bacterium]|nr:hypothetical protein FACS1894137_13490 [Spirochaetia bacterium]